MITSPYTYIAESLLEYLDRNLPGFMSEPMHVRLGLCHMIFQAATRFREHSHVAGYARFGYEELEQQFGRGGFNGINERLNIFEIKEDARGRQTWSKKRAHTKAYKLMPAVELLLCNFLHSCWDRSTKLLRKDGDYLETLPSAIASKNKSGQTRHGFKEVLINPAVPVNLGQLKTLVDDLQASIFAHYTGTKQVPNLAQVQERIREVQALVTYARNEKWHGYVPHRYVEAKSGRLYADGVPNLQNCSRDVRHAAMAGLYDIDIENCHYTLLAQMAEQHGYTCRAVRGYLDDKKRVRRELMDEFGIDEEQAKKAMIALIYGARFSYRPEDALPTILGSPELASQLYAYHSFRALRDDIAEARRIVLKAQPTSRGAIKNCRGLTIKADVSPEQKMAHLLQGLESAALEAACRLYPDAIVLLQHDGFSATRSLDIDAIEDAMQKATGYRLQVAQEQIRISLDGCAASLHGTGPRLDKTKPSVSNSSMVTLT